MYLRRHVEPDVADRVRALALPGVYFEREFRRYYPESEVVAHVVGFTNIDGEGQEGVEFAYDPELRGHAGAKQVIQDPARPQRGGRPERAFGAARARCPPDARSPAPVARVPGLSRRRCCGTRRPPGSVVVVDAVTGEIHAMVNQPSYNPNDPAKRKGPATRNRAVTDVFEPGSTVKPFAIVAALESGAARPETAVDTSPGVPAARPQRGARPARPRRARTWRG